MHVLQHKGAGLAPWNWMRYDIRTSGRTATVDDDPLVFYHFQGLKVINRWLYDPALREYRGIMPEELQHWLYNSYLCELRSAWTWAQTTDLTPPFGYSTLRGNSLVRKLMLGKRLVLRRLGRWGQP